VLGLLLYVAPIGNYVHLPSVMLFENDKPVIN